jgi:hypothetical protein
MKIAIITVMLMAALFCSKSEEEKKELAIKQKIDSLKPKITNIKIDPQAPISTSLIRAVPRLENPARAKGVTFVFQWYVNGEPVPGGIKQQLENKKLKKGDTLYCKATASWGKFTSKEVKSDKVTIGNSPPVINYTGVPPFKIPGQFRYKIKAVDPDGDKLTYRLIAPKDQDIYIDPDTGEIQWYITESTGAAEQEETGARQKDREKEAADESEAEKAPGVLPTLVEIKFEVLDSDGASANSSITLNLKEGKEEAL